jgi:tRNA(Ile)-lysidine synthase
MTAAEALDPNRLFADIDFGPGQSVVVAVSGGGDSLALLTLLHRYLAPAGEVRLVAATVDHGLRPESAAEAEQVGKLCVQLDVEHRILRWSGDKPASGLPAAARDARYRLLAEVADEAGATIIMTGHTADDQAETALMRRARGQGRGLAGMAPATLLDGRYWIVRPLLEARRAALRDFLRAEGIEWIDDPTNEDAAYERARARIALADPAEFRHTLETVRVTADQRLLHGERAAALIGSNASMPSPGLIQLAPGFGAETDPAAALYALRILFAVAGGREHLPDVGRTASLMKRFEGGPVRATLAGTVVDKREAGTFLHRESRSLPGPETISDGEVWDGRYRLDTLDGYRPVEVAPLGRKLAAEQEARQDERCPRSLRRAALAAQPALWRGAECLGRLGDQPLCAVHSTPLAAPWTRFLPSFDLAPAHAVLVLIGGNMPPALPYRGQESAEG